MTSTSTASQRRQQVVPSRGSDTLSEGEGLEFPLLLSCFFLSGLAALIYQTAWMRQFAVVFGTSELAIATVLSAYMAGLAAGAALAGRFLSRIRRPILAYGVLEFLIASGALLVPVGLRLARWLQVQILGGQAAPPDAGGWMQPLLYVVTTFVILFLPTACMGATLPLLVRHAIRRREEIGSRVGLLYAINTLGAVIGTIVAGFVLLPRLGLFATTVCGVFINMAVFAVAAWLTRIGPREHQGDESLHRAQELRPADQSIVWFRGLGWLLPLMLVSGLVSFTYEVLWSRLLGHVVGGSVHAFATMLATFLTGITLGSMIASRLAWSRQVALWGFLIAQLGTACLSMLMYEVIDSLPGMLTQGTAHDPVSPIWNAVRCSLVLLPSTICIGATFPFAVRALTDDPADAGRISARVYSWNTIGGVIGAVVAGFVIVPQLGFEGTARLAVGINLALAMLTLWLLPVRLPLRAAALVGVLMFAFVYTPGTPYGILGASSFGSSGPIRDKVTYLGVGRSSTVLVTEDKAVYRVSNNGLPEAVISPRGAPPSGRRVHLWLSALPLLARPDAESMLVVGFGSGGAVEIIPPSVRDIDVIELEPLIIEANQQLAHLRDNDPLSDPRVNIIINDARGALALTDKRYDIIISQPSHPWTAGASHLYTQEAMQIAADHLTDTGVYLQWMNAQFIDPSLFRSLGKTLLSVFPHVRLYMPGTDELLFVASAAPLDIERQLWQSGEPIRSSPEAYHIIGVNGVNDLAAALVLDTPGLDRLCADAPINTDDLNRLAFTTAHNRAATTGGELHDLLKQEDVLLQEDSELYLPSDLPLSPSVIAHRLSRQGFGKRLIDFGHSRTSTAEEALVRGVIEMDHGNGEQAAALFLQAVQLDPRLIDAAFDLCVMAASSLAEDPRPGPPLEGIIAKLPQPEATVLRASIALERDDFATIAALDEALARVSPEKACFGRAVRCRAAWRAGSTRAPNRQQLAAEAIPLADQAYGVSLSTMVLAMRLNACVMLRDAPAIMETALQILMNLEESTFDSSVKFLTEGDGARVILTQLERLRGNPQIDQARLKSVIGRYEDWIRASQQTQR